MKTKLFKIIILFSLTCLFLLTLLFLEAKVFTGLRSYVRGEGLYAKGQKDAVLALERYARTKKDEDFREYEEMIAIPIGDRKAREALQSSDPNLNNATVGFLLGGNLISDIPLMIDMFIYFNKLPFFKKAISIWERGDQAIIELDGYAYKLKEAVLNDEKKLVQDYLSKIDILNKELALLELDFSITISEGATLVTNVFLYTSLIFSLFIFIVLFLKIRYFVNRIVQIEEDLKINQEQLKKEIETKNRFFSILAHDLNNPFNQILGLTEMMAEDAENFTSEEISKTAKQVFDAASKTFNLQQNLLSWSEVQFKNGESKREETSLKEITDETFEVYEMIAENKGVQLVNKIENCTVYADPNMVQLIIRNLVSNAIKFTPEGGKVEVTSITKENLIQVTVSDNGVGMPPEKIKTLFNISTSVSEKGTGGEKGTGLGIGLCHDMIIKNNGNMWVESIEGIGTKVHFTLPKDSKL